MSSMRPLAVVSPLRHAYHRFLAQNRGIANCTRVLRESATRAEYPGARFGSRNSYAKYNRGKEGGSSISTGSWLLLGVPIATAGLGYWQVKRKAEKEALIETLSAQLSAEAIPLPVDDIAHVRALDYRRVTVRGHFDHDNEIIVGPRTLLREAFDGNAGESGYHVLTPFVVSGSAKSHRILVNRGWVPTEHGNPESRPEGQIKGEVDLEAIVYTPSAGKPNSFVPDNEPSSGRWYWVDLDGISQALDTSPILVEAAQSATPPSGIPIGGQSKITIRNEHMQYIVTWFTLSVVTLGMWFARVRPDRLLRISKAAR
eukprot:m.295434 g.295434  ORF g.295434 m.295434 type:complete len:314 (-) comp20039_c0_seq3:2289-3230(-)